MDTHRFWESLYSDVSVAKKIIYMILFFENYISFTDIKRVE